MSTETPMSRAGLRIRAKEAIARLGFDSRKLDTLVSLPKIETWRREHVPAGTPAFAERTDMYDHVYGKYVGEGPIDYLEFGVFEGSSMRHWAGLDTHPDSRFYGFDSFEGLPEDWQRFDGQMVRAHFDVGGSVPDIDDDRVEFIAGWFQKTLDDFLTDFEPKPKLVVHVDSDLYSSALYVLTRLDKLLVPGTIVIFDEFSSVLNEFAALGDYCGAYQREYDVLASAWHYFGHLAIRMR
ncbi:TylF/MycF/NovP-related O-methyltransferase [Nocardioides sp. Kera G14]|uniref:TylF/MycF/NovP-related O-methyltransferase n=1 Tax=Nocardioides sp. Kera G14 TaxID=2884264 RepID=UPI001D10F1E7|nr:TylF/MycF/NovP-related O-methyltransferase [Nocardioides sp. Kera G14]UDY23625.1 TylF/MycF family methyltransferase [Nocardioides sp. Kera G14]